MTMNVAERPSTVAAPPRELSSIARAIASEPVADAISPVVLIGIVRLLEFIGIAAIGAGAWVGLVYRNDDFSWAYMGAILAVSAAAVFAFQVFEIYSVPAFRSHVHQLS